MGTSGSRLAFVVALFATAPAAVLPQPVYRCGNTYSQTPCANGSIVRTDDPRTPQQKAQTDAATLQATQLGERMERDRLARESSPAYAADRPVTGKTGQRPTTTPARQTKPATRSTAPPREHTRVKAKTSPLPPAPDHFTATTRQDNKKKPAPGPTRP